MLLIILFIIMCHELEMYFSFIYLPDKELTIKFNKVMVALPYSQFKRREIKIDFEFRYYYLGRRNIIYECIYILLWMFHLSSINESILIQPQGIEEKRYVVVLFDFFFTLRYNLNGVKVVLHQSYIKIIIYL